GAGGARGRVGGWSLRLGEGGAAAALAGAGRITTAGGQLKSTRTGFRDPARTMAETDQFARRFGQHPVIIVVCADLDETHPTDTALARLTIACRAHDHPTAPHPRL